MKKILFTIFLFGVSLITYGKHVGVYCFFANDKSQLYEDYNVKAIVALDDGVLQLAIYNKTNSVIYVDRASSFGYTNGKADMMFKNSAYSTNNTSGGGVSVNAGSIANALGIGGVAGTIANGVNFGSGTSFQNGTTVYEQRVIAIAPQSLTVLYEWKYPHRYFKSNIVDVGKSGSTDDFERGKNGYFVSSYGTRDKFKVGASRHFNKQFTPLEVRGVIKYSTEESFSSFETISVSDYISDIIIDKRNNPQNLYQFANRPCYFFETGTTSALSIIGYTLLLVSLCGLAVYFLVA